MKTAVLIAEKPSLMRDIKNVYEKNINSIPYRIEFLCQRGHLYTLKMPSEIDPNYNRDWDSLPFIATEHGGWQYKVIKEKKVGNFPTSSERLQTIKNTIKEVSPDFIIHAGDPDREGQLLVDIVLSEIKNKLPVKRYWSNDLTDGAILNALLNLRDYNEDFMQNLLSSAYCRQHTDYIYGLNISSSASIKMKHTVSSGRVRSVFLELVRKREEDIKNFVPSTCYGVKVNYRNNLVGTYFNPSINEENINSSEEHSNAGIIWFDKKEEAADLIATLSDKAEVVSCICKNTKKQPPKLYRLATVQIDGAKLGYSDELVLSTIQSLYDRHYLSYPRTSCEYLSSHEDFNAYLDVCREVPGLDKYISMISQADIERIKNNKRYVNDDELKESGHSALRPTADKVNFDSLNKVEQDIYSMICRQYVAIFLPPLVQEKTEIITRIDEHYFKSNGTRLIDKGYSEIFDTQFNDTILDIVNKGDILDVNDFEISDRTSTCPRHLTSNDIIAICDNPSKYLMDSSLKNISGKKLKLGTDATRSSIIKSIIERDKYLEKQGKGKNPYLVLTPLGEEIAENMKNCMICKVDMTGELETQMDLIAKGKLSAEQYEHDIKISITKMIDDIRNMPMKPVTAATDEIREFGECPLCKHPIVAGKKSYFCSDYKNGCSFGIPVSICGANLSKADVISLINGNTLLKTMKKDGKSWSQQLRFTEEYKLEFVKEERKITDYDCPKCGRKLVSTSKGIYCPSFYEYYEQKKTNPEIDKSAFCAFSISRIICGKDIGEINVIELLTKKQTSKIKGFVSKKGKKFEAMLHMTEDYNIEFVFEEHENAEPEPTDYVCPLCGKGLLDYPKLIKCNCGFTIWKVMAGKRLSDEVIKDVLGYGCSKSVVYGFKSTKHKGKTFNARIALDREKKGLKFDFAN